MSEGDNGLERRGASSDKAAVHVYINIRYIIKIDCFKTKNIRLIKYFPLPVPVIANEAVTPSWCSSVRDRRRGTSCCCAAARLQASPFRPALSSRPPTWAQSAGMCPGPGPAALNHPDSDILSPSPSERPHWGGLKGGAGVGGDIYGQSVHTYTPMQLRFR